MPKLKQLPENCTFPQLAVVLDPQRFAACLQAGLGGDFATGQLEVRRVKLKRLYYKPGRSCRLIFDAKVRGRDGRKGRQQYFGKIAPDPKPASLYRRALQSALATPEFGPPVALVAELGLVLWAYPNDPNLPGLATLASAAAVAALVRADPARFGLPAGGELLDLRLGAGKYVPGQRCGYRYRALWRNGTGEREHLFYGKAYQAGVGGAAHDVLRAVAQSAACRSGRLRVPRPYGYDPEREIVWQEMLPGRSYAKNASAVDLAASAAPVAAALGAFHAEELALGPGLGLVAEIDALVHSTDKIARAYPAAAARSAALQARLLAAAPGLPTVPLAPVHGSFKISHVFDAGGQVAFIDFDGAGIGDPTYDVGRFLAHLTVAGLETKTGDGTLRRAVDGFRAAYAAAVPWGWPEARVRWYTAALLVSSQAYKCVKRMVPGRVEAILGAAEGWFPAE
jgi:hypothetical protein